MVDRLDAKKAVRRVKRSATAERTLRKLEQKDRPIRMPPGFLIVERAERPKEN